jgi:hypothetical protein
MRYNGMLIAWPILKNALNQPTAPEKMSCPRAQRCICSCLHSVTMLCIKGGGRNSVQPEGEYSRQLRLHLTSSVNEPRCGSITSIIHHSSYDAWAHHMPHTPRHSTCHCHTPQRTHPEMRQVAQRLQRQPVPAHTLPREGKTCIEEAAERQGWHLTMSLHSVPSPLSSHVAVYA